MPETFEALEAAGVEVVVEESSRAVEVDDELARTRRGGALIQPTC